MSSLVTKPLLKVDGLAVSYAGRKVVEHLSFALEEGDNKKEAQGKIVDEIMQSIANLQKWYLEGAHGIPP